MRQATAILKLVSSGTQTHTHTGDTGSEADQPGARGGEAQETGRAGIAPADASGLCERPQIKGIAARGARHDLLTDGMGSHTRIPGLWLDRLLEEGDDADLVSMIHRQHAWLCMMQDRMNHG